MYTAPFVKTTFQDNVAVIEFFHPKGNSMPSFLLGELAESINRVGQQSKISLILIKSVGSIFCAGAFFDELLEIETSQEGKKFFMGFANVILAMKLSKAIIVTQVQGKAVGGGVGIIAASDYVIASENTQLRLSEVKIGIGPFVIGPVIQNKIGSTNFVQLSLNPTKWYDVNWAFDKGLVHEVWKEDDFVQKTTDKITELSSYSNGSLIEMKRLFWRNTEYLLELMNSMAEISGNLVISNEVKAALKNQKG